MKDNKIDTPVSRGRLIVKRGISRGDHTSPARKTHTRLSVGRWDPSGVRLFPISNERQRWSFVNNVLPGSIEFQEMTDDPFPRTRQLRTIPENRGKHPDKISRANVSLSNPSQGYEGELLVGSGW